MVEFTDPIEMRRYIDRTINGFKSNIAGVVALDIEERLKSTVGSEIEISSSRDGAKITLSADADRDAIEKDLMEYLQTNIATIAMRAFPKEIRPNIGMK